MLYNLPIVDWEENMAERVKVGCINKRDRNNAHERIQAIGGANSNGTRARPA
jgi:hypothetical protein